MPCWIGTSPHLDQHPPRLTRSTMTSFRFTLFSSLWAFFFASSAMAQTPPLRLEHLPVSSGVLVSRALQANQNYFAFPLSPLLEFPLLTCSPAPCVLPNVDASQGPKPANETPIAVDGRNLKHILTGANDYNCTNAVGFYTSSDGASTWTRTCMSVLTGMVGLGDPALAYDLNGTAFAAGIEAPPNSTNGIVAFQTSTT